MTSSCDSIIEQLGISRATLTGRGLCEYPEAASLELAETGEDGKAYLLAPAAAAAWRDLKLAASQDGVT
ncbi:MAG: hypothetical protein ABI790_11635, partial [Betaproteobacteria bacterium]